MRGLVGGAYIECVLVCRCLASFDLGYGLEHQLAWILLDMQKKVGIAVDEDLA